MLPDDDFMAAIRRMAEASPALPRKEFKAPEEGPKLKVRLAIPVADGQMLVPIHIAHLYSGAEAETWAGGGDHIVLETQFEMGRIKRKAGDTLCLWRKRKGQKWGGAFDEVEADRRPNCKRCVELVKRWGAWLEVYTEGKKP